MEPPRPTRRGRPPKPEAERLEETVHARVPTDVYRAIRARAGEDLKTISAVVAEALTAIFREKKYG